MEGPDGKTERATGKKRGEEEAKGNVCISPEVVSLVVLLLGLIAIRLMAPLFFQQTGSMIMSAAKFEDIHDWNAQKITNWFNSGCISMGILLAPVFATVVIGTVVATVSQTGFLLCTEAFEFKPGSFNPINAMRSFFSMKSIVNVIISILKIGLICLIVHILTRKHVDVLLSLHNFPTIDSLQWFLALAFRICLTIVVVFVAIAAIDYIYRWYQYEKSIMMTKEEVKEEVKGQEQNPVIKRAQMKRMREFSLMRMMAEVPKANVIVTNPTHVAIALQYDPETMDAPKVVAKGLRLVAQRIKKIAAENDIPVVERPALARSLYKNVKLGHQIPSNFYEAVAEILAFIHKLGRGIKVAI